jgi:hypothetical protein
MKASLQPTLRKANIESTVLTRRPLNNHSYYLTDSDADKYLLSFFDIFKNRMAGEKLFSYMQRLGLLRLEENGQYSFLPKTRSKILPVVCLYKTLNDKGYLKRMTQTEAGYYFCKAFGKNISSIRMFYCDQLEFCNKYSEYFFHIPDHAEFIR